MPSVPTGIQPSGWASAPPGAPSAAGALLLRAALRGCHHEFAAAACAPSRRRSRHSDPSMAVRHRCLAVSRPLGVRVGLPAALRGPSEPAGVLQGTPGNQNSARQTPFLSVADCARSAAPASAWTALEATRVQSSGCCFRADCRCRPPDHRSRSRQRRRHAHHRAHDLGIRPAPRSSGTAAWPSAGRSASESAAQRPSEALPNLRGHLKYPRKSE